MHIPTRKSSSGFTLIELLTVIAIIGILAAIIIPTVGKVRETAQRSVDGANLREIGKAAAIYGTDNRDQMPDPTTAVTSREVAGSNSAYFRWFGQLAKFAAFNDATLLVSKLDSAVSQAAVPATVLNPNIPNKPTLNAEFSSLPAVSFNVVGGLRLSDPATTPLGFTRGLTTSGSWRASGASDDDKNVGVYKDTGGHVLFIGGNVQFFSRLDQDSNTGLVAPSGKTTNNLRQAVPNRNSGNSNVVRVYGADTGNGVASEAGTAPVPLN